MTALSYEELAVQVKKADSPLLFLDTCFILDIVRAPIRKQIGVQHIEAARTVNSLATQTPPRVSLVISEHVGLEFLNKIDKVEEETNNELRQVTGIHERMGVLSSANDTPSKIELSSFDFRQLAEHIVQASNILATHHDEIIKAYYRANLLVKPPAKKGKESQNDCLIIESYLRLAGVLYEAGFSHNMVFATSNINDYEQGHKKLHPVLRTEFEAVKLEYTSSWLAARHEIHR